MAIGAQGVVSVLSNLIPGEIRKMVHLSSEGRFKDASVIHHRLFPLMRAMFLDGNPVGIKWAMKVAGKDRGGVRVSLWGGREGAEKQIFGLMGGSGGAGALHKTLLTKTTLTILILSPATCGTVES